MNYLIDTNIISEVRKGAKCDRHVAAWYESIADADIYLSVLVLGEIRKGIERARPNDPAQARALEKWFTDIVKSFADRILPIDQVVADEWGRMSAKRPLSTTDACPLSTYQRRQSGHSNTDAKGGLQHEPAHYLPVGRGYRIGIWSVRSIPQPPPPTGRRVPMLCESLPWSAGCPRSVRLFHLRPRGKTFPRREGSRIRDSSIPHRRRSSFVPPAAADP